MPLRLLLLHAGALGDLALTLRLLLRAAPKFREAPLRVLSTTDPGDFRGSRPAIERRGWDGLGVHWLFRKDDEPAPDVLRSEVEGSAVISALAAGDSDHAVPRRLQALRPARLFSYDPRPDRPDGHGHITRQWEAALRLAGMQFDPCTRRTDAHVQLPPDMSERGRAELAAAGAPTSAGHPVALIHPGSGGREKCWPCERFIAVAQALRARSIQVIFILGPVEMERWSGAQVERLRGAGALIECADATRLLALLSAADGLLSNDSGPAHLAALIGRPTVTLFGPTCARRWRPLGPSATAIQGDGTAGADWGIDTARVIAAVERSVDRSPRFRFHC